MTDWSKVWFKGNLPDSWAEVSLGIFRQESSKTFNPSGRRDETFELYSVPSHATGSPEVVSGAEIGSNKQHVAPKNVLLSKINPRLNRTWIVADRGVHPQIASTEWIVFEGGLSIEPRFLGYVLQTKAVRDYLCQNASGVGGSLTRVRPNIVDDIHIGLPPLPEQKRIVAKVEELFSELDAGEENLIRARGLLGLYRQSLLKAAFQGDLTAAWREANKDKLEPPETLLARIRQERETRYAEALNAWQTALSEWRAGGEKGRKPGKPLRCAELVTSGNLTGHCPSGWVTVTVEGLLKEPLSNGRSVKDRKGGFKVLRLSAFRGNRLNLSEAKEGNWTAEDAEGWLVQEGDFFVVRGNGSKHLVGIGALAIGVQEPVAYPDTMIRLAIDRDVVLAEYFLLAWNSRILRDQIETAARTTAGIYKINQPHICGFMFPLPPLEEQRELVQMLEAQLSTIDATEAEITTALAKIAALRQSILKEAFSGRLVPQDPKDEPAAALLARLKPNPAPARSRKPRT